MNDTLVDKHVFGTILWRDESKAFLAVELQEKSNVSVEKNHGKVFAPITHPLACSRQRDEKGR